ncbi:MAG: transketolase C-terminal domain-containing protein, partial [Aeromicrobium sp.]
VLLDVALHKCGVTFVLDRAGITGDDGSSHNGMWDMSLLQIVPTLRLAAPRDGAQLREQLREAVAVDDAPTAVRFAKGPVPDDIESLERIGTFDVLSRDADKDVLIIAVGSLVPICVEAADLLRSQGRGVTVVDPRWVKPLDAELIDMAAAFGMVVTVEDNGRNGGVGSMFTQAMLDADITTPIRVHGVDQKFYDHAKRAVILERLGLTPTAIAADTEAALSANATQPGNIGAV